MLIGNVTMSRYNNYCINNLLKKCKKGKGGA